MSRNILSYLDSTRPEISDFLRENTLDDLLNVKGKDGITFLCPSDDYFNKISRASCDDAAEMIAALVIKIPLQTPRDWRGLEDIPNSQYPQQRVPFESVKGSVIHLTGATATLDVGFVDESKNKNLAVYTLVGEVAPTTDKPSAHAHIKHSKKPVAPPKPAPVISSLRRRIIANIEKQTYEYYQSRDPYERPRNAYNVALNSLINFIITQPWTESKQEKQRLLLQNVLPIAIYAPFDLYLILEPFGPMSADYLIPDEVVVDWNRAGECSGPYPGVARAFHDQLMSLKEASELGDGAAIYTRRPELIRTIEAARVGQMETTAVKARESTTAMCALYNKLYDANKIGDVSNVYPKTIAEIYRIPLMKQMHDELRFYTYDAYNTLNSKSYFESEIFRDIIERIHSMLRSPTEPRLRIFDPRRIKDALAPTAERDEVVLFVNSTMFLSMPMTTADTALFSKGITAKPTPTNRKFWNIQRAIEAVHTFTPTDKKKSDLYTRIARESQDGETRKLARELLGGYDD